MRGKRREIAVRGGGVIGTNGVDARPSNRISRNTIGRLSGFLIAVYLLFPCSIIAGNWDVFREASRRITSIEAAFIQRKTLPILAKPFVSSGRFFYQPPASLRWEYERPIRNVLLMHKGAVKRYLREKDVWREDAGASHPAMQKVLEEIVRWQQGRFDDNPHFQASLVDGVEPKVILVPREASWKKMMRQIELTPSEEQAGVIRTVRMVEDERTSTVIEFNQVRLNRPLPAALFVNLE